MSAHSIEALRNAIYSSSGSVSDEDIRTMTIELAGMSDEAIENLLTEILSR